MATAFLGLGSNLGKPEQNIQQALQALQTSGIGQVKRVSTVICTQAVGYTSQPDFANATAEIETSFLPEALLHSLKQLEKDRGREYRFQWGPREIDIDILLYDDLVMRSALLCIPHPRMHERLFVLEPLAEIAPEKICPLRKKSIREILDELLLATDGNI